MLTINARLSPIVRSLIIYRSNRGEETTYMHISAHQQEQQQQIHTLNSNLCKSVVKERERDRKAEDRNKKIKYPALFMHAHCTGNKGTENRCTVNYNKIQLKQHCREDLTNSLFCITLQKQIIKIANQSIESI